MMKEHLKHILTLTSCAVLTLLPTSCIDEDNEDCEVVDNGVEYELIYDHRLITNMDDEINEELRTADEVELGKRLRAAITVDVFREFGHELDLSFYTNQARSHQQTVTMNADQTTLHFKLPLAQYRHLAISNATSESNISLTGANELNDAYLLQMKADTLNSYKQGVYTARKDLLESTLMQRHLIQLYTITDAAAIVLNPQDVKIKSIKTYITNLADGFQVSDSTFTYNNNPIVRCNDLQDTGSSLICHFGFGLPSHNSPMTRADYDNVWEGSYWEMRVYVTLSDGKITENLLYVKEPLKAGFLKIIKGIIREDGTIAVENQEVGVSANVEWTPGETYYPVFRKE